MIYSIIFTVSILKKRFTVNKFTVNPPWAWKANKRRPVNLNKPAASIHKGPCYVFQIAQQTALPEDDDEL